MRALQTSALGLLAAALMAGCGAGGTTITVTPPAPAADTPPISTTRSAAAPTTTPARPAPSYPVVPFTFVSTATARGRWPFTAQLASITENPNGFSGAGEPPQDTYLMVQVNVTSKITGRLVPAPKLTVSCHAPGDRSWEAGPFSATGYDEGPGTDPSPGGNAVSLGDGQPHPWDVEWQVPIGTSTTNVKCVLRPDPPDSSLYAYLPHVLVAGSGRLN
ncbi:MAG TPA: hypothetical protein VFY36_05430 [Solirubrobacteraceae bacterium]|nr:hypothetical protein [Solirubrobacteraceae bacterium]